MSSRAVGYLLIVSAALLWSTNGVLAKAIAQSGMNDIAWVAAFRTFFAGSSMVLIGLLTRRKATFHPMMLLMMFCFATMNYTFVAALSMTQTSSALFLQYTATLWIILFSVVFLREKLDRASLGSLLIGMVGIVGIVYGTYSPEPKAQQAIMFGLLSGLLYAGVAVTIRYLSKHDPIWLATLNLSSAFVLSVAIALFGYLLEGSIIPIAKGDPASIAIPYQNWWCMLWLFLFGAVQLAIPYCLFGAGLKSISAQEAGLITLLEAVCSPIWTYLLFGETPAIPIIWGGALLLFAIVLRYLPQFATKSSPSESG